LPQFRQRIAADHRRQQQPIRPQCATNLRQHAGQIVDELKRERGDDEIERCRLEWERLGLLVRQVDTRELIETPGQRVANLIARRSNVSRALEFPQHGMQPLRHLLGDAIEQEGRRSKASRAILPRAQERAIKQDRRRGRGVSHAGWYAGRAICGNPAFSGRHDCGAVLESAPLRTTYGVNRL